MRLFSVCALLAHYVAASYGPLNFNASFGSSPAPFVINVDPQFIEQTRQKVAFSRYPFEFEGVAPFEDGPPLQNATTISNYWINKYNWTKTQADINSKYRMFTTTVRPDNRSDYPYDVKLHFIHHRSARADAIPLLFMHGWPGNFLEVGHIIDALTNPPNSSLPAFHVVTPSNPGIGFSPPAIEHSRLGPKAVAHSHAALMKQLGYEKFVIQAGDWGGVMLRIIASAYPDNVVSALANIWLEPVTADDRAAVANGTAGSEAARYLEIYDTYARNISGYRGIQQTYPLQLEYALTDSPIGWTMWIWQLMATGASTIFWDLDTIITWSLMYYIQGPYTGGRFYKLALWDGLVAANGYDWGSPAIANNIKPPIALSEFPKDIWAGLPLEWAQRAGNVVVKYSHNTGGHFAATEVPGLLLEDIWRFFGNKTLSNTQVFY